MDLAAGCNVCGGAVTTRFSEVRDPQTGELFSILECPACGLGQTSPQPDDLGRYYGAAYHGGRHGFTARHCIARRLEFVQTVAGPGRGRALLDVGCGDGSFLEAARSRSGWLIAGTEMNPAAARSKGIAVRDSIEAIGPVAGPFDCITLWHSLEHIRDPMSALKTLSTFLVPGGVLVAAVPNYGGLQARAFGAGWFHLDVPRHLFHFRRRSLALALSSAGLAPFQEWHQEFEYDLFGWSQSALNRFMHVPNGFFYQLTGKPTSASPVERIMNLAIGTMLTGLSLPAVVAGSAFKRGGTLVIAARK
ncbi:MAG TPA: class I SAM-dependent methyltransferase [Polyangia bacterium]|nr:class I SAM-dependent methyltransferase [Polyangia bacterium]